MFSEMCELQNDIANNNNIDIISQYLYYIM